jgi:spore maturation protein CgeB
MKMRFVILGLSITSSWGNGHATTFRGLVRGLAERGHDVVFLERDVPWYADNRDYPKCKYCRIGLYEDLDELHTKYAECVRKADVVIVGSYVPDGILVGQWAIENARKLTAFYDIDTPVTLAKLERDECDYLSPELIARYQLYLSFTGGPTLQHIENRYRSPMARALYCSVDPNLYFPEERKKKWALGYLGTYSKDRQPGLRELILKPARQLPKHKFIVAGPQYPKTIQWPDNVERVEHLPPNLHRAFYNEQEFTLNVTRDDMKQAGFSPSVRLFEAAACGTPIISDYWPGLETLLEPNKEILISTCATDTVQYLTEITPQTRVAIGARARERILAEHTASHRAAELEEYAAKLLGKISKRRRAPRLAPATKGYL